MTNSSPGSNASAIAKCIDSYASRILRPAAWSVAARAVRQVVRAADPKTTSEARGLLAAACCFLNGPNGWMHDEAPNFAALLTDEAIRKHLDTLNSNTARVRRSQLRTLAAAANGESIERFTPVRRIPLDPRVWAIYRYFPGANVAVLGAAFIALTGAGLSAYRLDGLIEYETYISNAPATSAGTVEPSTAIEVARVVPNQAVNKEAESRTTPANTTSSRAARPAAKPKTKTARIAFDRANRAAFKAATAPPQLAPEPDIAALDEEVQKRINTYQPKFLTDRVAWPRIEKLTRRLAVGYQPTSPRVAGHACAVIRKFLMWVLEHPLASDQDQKPSNANPAGEETPALELRATDLLGKDLVDAYIKVRLAAGDASSTAGSARAILNKAIASLTVAPLKKRLTATPIQPPYSPDECDELVEFALNQPSTARGRSAAFILGLGLGAGLSAADMRYVRVKHIKTHTIQAGTYLTVTVPAPAKAPRTVVIRNQYKELVEFAINAATSPEAFLVGTKPDRANVTPHGDREMVAASGVRIRYSVERLRTTWLFAMMNAPIPLPALLRAAGLKTARTLADLLPLCPTPEPAELNKIVTTVRNAFIATGGGEQP